MPVSLCAHNVPGHVLCIRTQVGKENSVHLKKVALQKQGKQEEIEKGIIASFGCGDLHYLSRLAEAGSSVFRLPRTLFEICTLFTTKLAKVLTSCSWLHHLTPHRVMHFKTMKKILHLHEQCFYLEYVLHNPIILSTVFRSRFPGWIYRFGFDLLQNIFNSAQLGLIPLPVSGHGILIIVRESLD